MKRTRSALFAALFALAILGKVASPAAQTDEEFDKIFPFLGHWDPQIAGPDGQDRGNCGGLTGDFGEKLVNCTIPVGRLPFNSRAEAWLKYKDQLQSPTQADCAQIAFPAVLGDSIYITAYPGRLVTEHPSNPWHLVRTVWMNGTGPTPIPGELFQHGLSRGRFDGSDLIIESTHFTFDPDGMEDHLHMASSVRKKITERYHLIDDESMRLTITLEDPTFLTKPFTYAWTFTKAGMRGPNQGWRNCDAESARREQEFAYPATKYLDAR